MPGPPLSSFFSLFFQTFAIICLLICPLLAKARWAEPEEAAYVVNFERTRVEVRKDGAATYVTERQIEILKDSARTSQGLARRTFNSSTSRFRVLEAKTIHQNRALRVLKKDIETKPLASTGPGFDVFSQTTVAFPEVNIGSKLYIKTELIETKPKIPGLFFYTERLWQESFQDFEINVNSKIPIYSELYDPEGFFVRTSDAKSVRFKLRKPYFKWIREEDDGLSDGKSFVWFGATSLKNWNDFPKTTLMAYENDLDSPVPDKFATILKQAEELKTDVEKMNLVTSEIANAVRYVGDWRALEGLWHPRGLSKVASTGYGDCKDFSVLTGAILRKLGFIVHAAWIGRGTKWIESPLSISTFEINHAILNVSKDGREYWIDPTNSTSFAQGIYPDIADRRVYVLEPEGLREKRVPPLSSKEATVQIKNRISFADAAILKGEGSLTIGGRAAEQWAGAQLSSSKKSLDYALIGWAASPPQLETWRLGEYDLKSRVTADFTTSFAYTERFRPQLTSAGHGYTVPATFFVKNFQFRTDDKVAMPKIAEPQKLTREVRFSGRDILYRKELKCSGQSPWADFSRTIQKEARDVVLTDTIEVKMNFIPLEDLKKKEFVELQNSLLDCLQDTVLVFKDSI